MKMLLDVKRVLKFGHAGASAVRCQDMRGICLNTGWQSGNALDTFGLRRGRVEIQWLFGATWVQIPSPAPKHLGVQGGPTTFLAEFSSTVFS